MTQPRSWLACSRCVVQDGPCFGQVGGSKLMRSLVTGLCVLAGRSSWRLGSTH